MKHIKIILIGLCIVSIAILSYPNKTHAEDGKVSLTILRGYLTIKGTGTITLSTINTLPISQDITGSLTPNTFQLQDKVGGCSGYYTSIQADHLSNGSNIITNENISFKSITNPNTVLGSSNNQVKFGNALQNIRSPINNPVTYFFRETGLGCTIIGQYGDTPQIKIHIPANQLSGNYRGKVYYLLYDKASN